MRSGDVGDGFEPRFEVLGDGDDPVAREQLHIVRIVELPDHGVGLHPFGPFDHRFDTEFVTDRERQPAEAPRLSLVVRVAGDAQQQTTGVSLGKIRQKYDACHLETF